MKVAIIGSRTLKIDSIERYLPQGITEIVSGGARGVDSCARQYAAEHQLVFTEFLPDYRRYGRGAPLRRNLAIIEYADRLIAFWDGVSRGTKHTIDACKKVNKHVTVYRCDPELQ